MAAVIPLITKTVFYSSRNSSACTGITLMFEHVNLSQMNLKPRIIAKILNCELSGVK